MYPFAFVLVYVLFYGTIIMVGAALYMGYLHWQEERRQPSPTRPARNVQPSGRPTPIAAHDAATLRKAS